MRLRAEISNTDRACGAMLSGEVAKRYGHDGLPDDTIHVHFTGTAGQSFGAWLARGITFELEGDANDYVGKGLSGGRIVIRPPADSGIVPEESIIVGNTVLYGAIAGECYFRGVAGERFAVRNSGAIAVVEGAGDHCCEYMTGGVVVVLGTTGRNFAAGMSGGIAYVLDEDNTFESRCNMAMVELEPVPDEEKIAETEYGHYNDLESHGRVDMMGDLTDNDAERLHKLISDHARYTGSKRAAEILADWNALSPDVPESDAGRISPRARRDGKGEGRHDAGRGVKMGKVTGFLEIERSDRDYEPVETRIRHYREFVLPLPEDDTRKQAARCMDCGVPYCHGTSRITGAPTGCPVNNQIPDWNDLVYRGNWEEAARNLHSTNNFPEVTGRICPAPCEASCTLNINDNPVTIKTIECAIADRAIAERLDQARSRDGQDRQEGRDRRLRPGRHGLRAAARPRRPRRACLRALGQGRRPAALRHPRLQDGEGHVDRRVEQMQAEGVTFHYGAHVGVDAAGREAGRRTTTRSCSPAAPRSRATCRSPAATSRASISRWTSCRSRTAASAAKPLGDVAPILATGKKVVVIGGGDTGSDCIGTSIRQGAVSVINFEIMPQPPEHENKPLTWPLWPLKLRTSSSHEEGATREFAVLTQKFSGENGQVKKLHCARVDAKFQPVPGTEFEIEADLVLLAMGFVHPVHEGLLKSLDVALDKRGNVSADTSAYLTSVPKVFAAGDMRRGQSLVVWAIREGRQCAHAVDKFLMGATTLPR